MSLMKLDEILHRVFWGLIAAVAMYASSTMKDMQVTMGDMNMKLAQIIQRSEFQEKSLLDHESRLRSLEHK